MATKKESGGSAKAAPKSAPKAGVKGASKETAVAEAPTKAGSKAVAKAKSTDVAEFDDLSSLAQEAMGFEEEVRAMSGVSNTWIKCLQAGAEQTIRTSKDYIKGAEAGDFCIPDKGICKEVLRCAPIGMFKVYAEKKPGGEDSEMDITVGFWHPDDAEQVPLKDGDNFKRLLRNGNYLQPMHWIFVYLYDYPEITDALIPFQSIGNSYYSKIMKMVRDNSTICAELRLDFKAVSQKNEDYNKTYFYPGAEISGKNFNFDPKTGKVSPADDGPSVGVVGDIITRYHACQKKFHDGRIITRRSPQALIAAAGAAGPVERKGLPGSAGQEYADDSEEEAPNF